MEAPSGDAPSRTGEEVVGVTVVVVVTVVVGVTVVVTVVVVTTVCRAEFPGRGTLGPAVESRRRCQGTTPTGEEVRSATERTRCVNAVVMGTVTRKGPGTIPTTGWRRRRRVWTTLPWTSRRSTQVATPMCFTFRLRTGALWGPCALTWRESTWDFRCPPPSLVLGRTLTVICIIL